MSIADPQRLLPRENSFASVFPLPLTPFEAFMVEDAVNGYAMMADLEMQFDGRIERAAFDAALAFAVARNPLFTCRVERGPRGALQWVPTDRRPPVRWLSIDDPLDDAYGALTDLAGEPGLRIWVRAGQEQSKVLLHFHHACADAIGTFGFIEDFLVGYASAMASSPEIEARPLDPCRLLRRGEAALAGRPLGRRIVDALAGAREGLKFFWQRPVPLAGDPGAASAVPPVRPAFITVSLSDEETSDLRRVASAQGATTNDLLLRDLFLVLRRWNAARGGPRGRRLRILMPQNLREPDDYAMPVANVLGFAFVTRHPDWCDRPEALLQSISEETEAVRRGKLSLYFLDGLAKARSLGLLPSLLRSRLCFATIVLTNMGDPTRRFVARFPRTQRGLVVGNLIFRNVFGGPPSRPQTHAAFAVHSMGNISLTFKWDPRHYTPQNARELCDEYIAQLRCTAGSYRCEHASEVAGSRVM